MDKINIMYLVTSNSRYGIEKASEWNSLKSLNTHIAAIATQKDWSMYFHMEAIVNFKNSDGTLRESKLLRINRPVEITL